MISSATTSHPRSLAFCRIGSSRRAAIVPPRTGRRCFGHHTMWSPRSYTPPQTDAPSGSRPASIMHMRCVQQIRYVMAEVNSADTCTPLRSERAREVVRPPAEAGGPLARKLDGQQHFLDPRIPALGSPGAPPDLCRTDGRLLDGPSHLHGTPGRLASSRAHRPRARAGGRTACDRVQPRRSAATTAGRRTGSTDVGVRRRAVLLSGGTSHRGAPAARCEGGAGRDRYPRCPRPVWRIPVSTHLPTGTGGGRPRPGGWPCRRGAGRAPCGAGAA